VNANISFPVTIVQIIYVIVIIELTWSTKPFSLSLLSLSFPDLSPESDPEGGPKWSLDMAEETADTAECSEENANLPVAVQSPMRAPILL
jgi:hypothetical protein